MSFQKVLENLGFRPAEVKVYLEALQLGTSTVSDLAHKTNIPRTTVQEIVISLKKRGLMSMIMSKSHKVWMAENPNKILSMMKRQESELVSILPELQSLRYEQGSKPIVRVFNGKDEIMLLMDDIIETKQHIKAILSWEKWIRLFGEEYVMGFVKRRCDHFLKMKLLSPKVPIAEKMTERDAEELRHTCYLPDDVAINTSTYIYGNKVGLISLNKKFPVGVLVEDEDITHTMTVLFDTLWYRGLHK